MPDERFHSVRLDDGRRLLAIPAIDAQRGAIAFIDGRAHADVDQKT